MAHDKFDLTIARRPVRLIRSPQGDKYNIRTMLARGIRHDVAVWALDKIRSGVVEQPDTFAWAIAKNEKNLDPAYIARKQTGERLVERVYETMSEAEHEQLVEDERLAAAADRSEEDALTNLPDLVRDDEVLLPKPKRTRKRAAATPKRRGPRPTPARDRAAREEMRKIRAAR